MNIFFKTIYTFGQWVYILDLSYSGHLIIHFLQNIETSYELHTLSVRLSMNGLPTKKKFNIQVLEPLLRHVTDINDINKKPNQHFFTQYTVHDSLSYTSIDST